VAEVREHVAERERAAAAAFGPPKPPSRWPLPLLVLVLVAAVGRSVWIQRQPVPLAGPERLERSVRATIYLGVNAVELYRSQHGRLPATLAETVENDLEATYVPDGERFSLTATVGEVTLTYRSGDDLAPYAAAFDPPPDPP
jgi:hypothetical protein